MPNPLLTPKDCCLVVVDPQPGLAFAVQSIDRQILLNNLHALIATARAFSIPYIVTTSATKVYSGPVMTALRDLVPAESVIDRRGMNAWEDENVRSAIQKTARKNIVIAGLLTESCVSFPALHAQNDGYGVTVVGDACGGATLESHNLAMQRMAHSGITPTSWLQFLLELQRDWTNRITYDAARSIVEHHAGGYGIGLNYARDMISPPPGAAAAKPA